MSFRSCDVILHILKDTAFSFYISCIIEACEFSEHLIKICRKKQEVAKMNSNDPWTKSIGLLLFFLTSIEAMVFIFILLMISCSCCLYCICRRESDNDELKLLSKCYLCIHIYYEQTIMFSLLQFHFSIDPTLLPNAAEAV